MKKIKQILLLLIVLISLALYAKVDHGTPLFREKIEQLKKKYPNGTYWNSGDPNTVTHKPCNHNKNGSKYCTRYETNYQCMGFAIKLSDDIFGYDKNKPRIVTHRLENVNVGDIIRFYNGDVRHSALVLSINNNIYTTVECNSKGHCEILWGLKRRKNEFQGSMCYVIKAPVDMYRAVMNKSSLK